MLVQYLNKELKVKQKNILDVFKRYGFDIGRTALSQMMEQSQKTSNVRGQSLIYNREKGVGGVSGVYNKSTPSEAAPPTP